MPTNRAYLITAPLLLLAVQMYWRLGSLDTATSSSSTANTVGVGGDGGDDGGTALLARLEALNEQARAMGEVTDGIIRVAAMTVLPPAAATSSTARLRGQPTAAGHARQRAFAGVRARRRACSQGECAAHTRG